MLLNSFAGDLLLAMRNKCDILRAAILTPESVGMLANDQVATELITRICRPGKVFVDVGAHLGSVISQVQRHDGTIVIVAIEAIPEKIAKLRQKFQNVTLHECAAGESEDDASFFIDTKRSGYSSLIRSQVPNGEAIQEINVSIRKLDDLLPSGEVDAIKIDVEGAELGVLRGGESIVSRSRPTILFESVPLENGCLRYSK